MRVLMLSADRGLFNKGGIGDAVKRHKVYADLAGALDVIVFASQEYEDGVLADNLRVFSTKSTKLSHWKAAVQKGLKLSNREPYDIIVCQDVAAPAGVELKKRLGIPIVIGVHSMFFDARLKGVNLLQWYLSYKIKKALTHADAIRVNTRAIEFEIKKLIPATHIIIEPTPVDISSFKVETKERDKTPSILYVGRLSHEKNVSMLIHVLREMEGDFKAVIVGDGPEKERLAELSHGDSRITFVGAQRYEDLPKYYKEASIFVLPSQSESFGKVLLEASASQCAIVATRTEGAQSILTHEKDALLVPVGDKKALQMALESLFGDVDLQEALGKQAFQTARKYSFDQSCERIVSFWKEVAKQ